ncbi:MAG: hypothetical protein KBT03_12765 [Bacteroidales bacterium]|nr:hypothetical protein [Candidatus Scybalousia scybalohippi]
MKVTVKEVFQDKITGVVYQPGEIINVDDKDRIADMQKKNLIEVAVEKVAEPIIKKTATRKGK